LALSNKKVEQPIRRLNITTFLPEAKIPMKRDKDRL